MEKTFKFNDQNVQVSIYSNNIIRVRVGKEFEPSLFERYNMWKNLDNVGTIENDVLTAGDLSVSYSNGKISFKTSKIERVIDLKERGFIRPFCLSEPVLVPKIGLEPTHPCEY